MALRDHRFRETLPSELKEDLEKYLQNPGCACNTPFYKKLMLNCKDQLSAYYPNRAVADLQEEAQKLAQNNFSVINCNIDELEGKLKKLPSGRKQIAVTRFEDKVTVIINEIDVVY